ncbi:MULTISPECIES: sulfatase-like hydrolase/transferase [unclassified Tenacibaculum]|uniref:sulfatase-like hydrolase/transferase n=1 Tax=unclassified Tenacibaculum TaxID=2635139 RepID=UPI001F1F7BDE|nr:MULTISPECIES: sulfatase-like hydrolase/transferase [unclassified Tenacibaculum]MCF2875802.1 sulfatase-like hydrolase/transferase [Tenacibaculum sp. Cn5-1]MCF2935877.1 sulfatase-like hydrolase/transferase [Tenacibaculum sp. Cn5-34]MCG7512438.1 sulfatase-like hydrolase/transferase [Tenacibaculum sp. Cn5-46]
MTTHIKRMLFFAVVYFFIISCSSSDSIVNENPDGNPTQNGSAPNILFVIADDMGLDATPGYSIGNQKPTMPNLQNLINSGVRFNNAWSNPTCSPTRASIITGKYGIRNGVLKVDDPLSTSEVALQDYIKSNASNSYSSAVIGKWHLSKNANHPNNMGIDYYAGPLSGGLQSYTNWNLTINGQTQTSTEYATTKVTDLAIDWVKDQTKPWFLWLAYNAPHTPFHLPPNDLHSQGALPSDQASIDANPLPYYLAMIEAMDSEYGRLLSSMSQEVRDNTIIIFIGDNGTPNQVLQGYKKGKGTLFQGGINIPMIIGGKGVTRFNQTEDALINLTDLFATIADIAGVSVSSIHDSRSFKSLLTQNTNDNSRDYTFIEDGNDDGTVDYTIRNATHKYILYNDGSEALFNLASDPFENTNFMNANQLPLSAANSAMKDELSAKLTEIRN